MNVNELGFVKMDGGGMILTDNKLNFSVIEGCWNCYYCNNDCKSMPCNECCYITSQALTPCKPWHWRQK